MTAPSMIEVRWSWLRAHHFADESIYCESVAKAEDIVYSGSEDDHYDDSTQRRQRYEAKGRQFLAGQAPRIFSAALRGPFEGWKENPWRATGGRVTDQATTEPSDHGKRSKPKQPKKKKSRRRPRAPTKVVEIDSDREETAPQGTSDDRHDSVDHTSNVIRQSEEPQALDDASFDNPYMDETELARVQDWRVNVDAKVPQRDNFWVENARRSKKRHSDQGWLLGKGAKRSRLSLPDDETVDSPTQAMLKNREANGVYPSITQSAVQENDLLEELRMATVPSPLAPQHPESSSAPQMASGQRIATDLRSVGESRVAQISTVDVASSNPDDAIHEKRKLPWESQTESATQEGGRTKRKGRKTRLNSSQGSFKITKRSHRTREIRNSGDRDLQNSVAVQDIDNPVFESQQDASFYFRAKSRPAGGQEVAETEEASVDAPAADLAMPFLPELPESPSPASHRASDPAALQTTDTQPTSSSAIRIKPRRSVRDSGAKRHRISIDEPVIVEVGSPEKPPTTTSSARIKPRRAVRDPNAIRQRISLDEPTIVELGSPAPSRYSDLKASPSKARLAVEASPASTSDLSDVPSCAGPPAGCKDTSSTMIKSARFEEAETTAVPTRYAVLKGLPEDDADAVVERSVETTVPRQYADLKKSLVESEEVSARFMDETTLLQSQADLSAVPRTYAEVKNRNLANANPPAQSDVSAVSGTYAELKDQHMNETTLLPSQADISIVPETYAEIKNGHASQPQCSTPPSSKRRRLSQEDPDSERISSVQTEAADDSGVLPGVAVESRPSEAASEIVNNAIQPAESEPAIEVKADAAESHEEAADEEPDDSALVILPSSQEAWGIPESPSSAQTSASSTQSVSEDEATESPRPETPRVGTQDQSPWKQDLPVIAEPAMPCLGSSFICGPHGSDDSQDLPSPLPERNVLSPTSGNRVQSPNPVRPSTPDTKHSGLPTPEFTFSIKSFRRLLSASPERRPSARSSIGSILSNPWTKASKPARHVHFAPLPGEDDESVDSPTSSSVSSDGPSDVNDEDYIEAGLPKQQKRRRISVAKPEPTRPQVRAASPPPMASLQDLPDEVDRFHKHYTVMEDRRGRGTAAIRMRKSLLPSASQQGVGSQGVEAMANRFLAAEEMITKRDTVMDLPIQKTWGDQEAASSPKPVAMSQSPEPEPGVDDVSAVLDNIDDFISLSNLDKEVDLARTETRESFGKRRPLFTSSLDLEANVW